MKQFIESCMSLAKFIGRMFTNSGWWPFTFILLVAGCHNSNYVEGTSTNLGIYLPTTDGIVGVQVLSYLNGVKVTTSTNQPFKITRVHYATNSYFGVVKTIENTHTTVEVGAAQNMQIPAFNAMLPVDYIWEDFTLDDEIHTNSVRSVQK